MNLALWSASMPIEWTGTWPVQLRADPRPWNGRRLTRREVEGCLAVFSGEMWATGREGLAAQAAYEWLSEHAR
jgi:hypothetical protein